MLYPAEKPETLDIGPTMTVRDLVRAYPRCLDLLFERGITPAHAGMTLAQVAAANRFRLENFLSALKRAALRP